MFIVVGSYKWSIAVCAIASILGCFAIMEAQTPHTAQNYSKSADELPGFEVASVKMNPRTEQTLSINQTPTTFRATHVTLELLIRIAYGVHFRHLEGYPAWVDGQFYDIDAKVTGEKVLSAQERIAALRVLLTSRFHLIVHKEVRTVAGYNLIVAKKGTNLTVSQRAGQGYTLPDSLYYPCVTLTYFATLLESVAGRPVVDLTGIAGEYSVRLEYAPIDEPDSTLPSIFTALENQLGLKLVPAKVASEYLVVDHVEKVPTEN